MKGDGNSIATHFRLNDPRTGRWFTMDPVTHFSQSPYTSMDNDPVNLFDPNGADVFSDIGNWIGEAASDVGNAISSAYDATSDFLSGTADTPLGPGTNGVLNDIGDAIGSVEIGPISVTEVVPEPEQDNAAISMPNIRPEYEFMADWDSQIRSYLYSNDPVFFAVGGVNAMIYTTLDVLMISWTNQAHFWGLNALPARNLKGEFVNNSAVQDAFGLTAALIVMGLEARFLKAPNPTVVKSPNSKIDELIAAAQKKYPKKAGKIELHHPIPEYLGGAKKQTLVPLDAAYHQLITNEFFKFWPKKLPGKVKTYPTYQEAQEIMRKVYNKYPLPKK